MFEDVLSFIEENERFLISGHVKPDGDCLGTEVALFHFLRHMGKKVRILNADSLERSLDFLGDDTPFEVHRKGQALPEHDVHCLVDCSTLQRTGSVGQAAEGLDHVKYLVVDHHVGSDLGDGDVLLWNPQAPSCGCLVYDLYRTAGAPLTPEAAEGIFVSIVADTGWFQYSNTSDEALAIAANLVTVGVKPHLIYNRLYRRNPREQIELLGEALGHVRFEEDGRLAICALPRSFMAKAESGGFNTDEILDQCRSVGGVEIVALLKEILDGKVKISLRSSDRYDVDDIARSFGGGGHKKASGAELPGPLPEAERALEELCLERLRD